MFKQFAERLVARLNISWETMDFELHHLSKGRHSETHRCQFSGPSGPVGAVSNRAGFYPQTVYTPKNLLSPKGTASV